MIRAVVIYPRSAGTKFDANYWLTVHMPLVGAKIPGVRWEADLGGPDQPHHAVAHLIFPSLESFASAASSPEFAEVGADMANYTDITPVMYISEIAATS